MIKLIQIISSRRCSTLSNIEFTKRQEMSMDKELRHSPNPVIKKISSNELNSILTDNLNALINLFKKYNYELRIAGGAVR